MRIIAGAARGRQLSVPPQGTRPTSDRVREAMFSSLQSILTAQDRPWSALHVLDAYAGSGALGLEALSRGAASVLLVDKRAAAAEVIRRNIERVGIPGARVAVSTIRALARRPADGPRFDLVLADPPYDIPATQVADELRDLVRAGWLAPDAQVVVERPRSDPRSPIPWTDVERREYGDTVLWYGRVGSEDAVQREELGDA